MIDKIIGKNGDWPIYTSDVYPFINYIGYEDETGAIHLYEDDIEDVEYYEW